MRKLLITCFNLFFLNSFTSLPLFAISEDWQHGVIYLEDTMLKGEVKFDPNLDVVLYKTEGKIQTYTAHTVHLFKFKDEEMGVIRTFKSLSQPANTSLGAKEFYEIVFEGDLTLVRKNSLPANTNITIPVLPINWMARRPSNEMKYNYYIKSGNKLIEIRNFRKQVLPLMADQKERIEHHIQNHNFRLNKPTSYMLIINYYNHLKKGVLTKD